MCRTSRSAIFTYLLMLICRLALPVASLAADAHRPNVLWICADDHAAYVCGAYGNRVVRTPHIDSLAAGGMRFECAYCNSPVCTASRQSFLTGRYPRTIGVTQLSTALPESETTLAERLHDVGYDTAAIGKMHFNSALRHGFDTRIDLPDHQRWLQAKGKTPVAAGVAIQPAWRPFRDPASVWLNSAAVPYGALDADMSGTYFAAEAARFLTERTQQAGIERKDEQHPFFLMVSFYEAHSPFIFPVEYQGRHQPGEFSVPIVRAEDDAQIPAIFRDLSGPQKQGISAAYYTSVEFLDKNVGRVLDALERAGLTDETLVIYTGDHGYMLGQHGRFEKHCSYEPAIRSPLVMRFPGRIKLASSSRALVELIDIAPTALEFCQADIPQSIQGKSLVPLLTGDTDRHRNEVFIEYSENEEAALRTERWKFIYTTGKRERRDGYSTGRPLPGRSIRLYDLDDDPDELTNIAGRAENTALVVEFTQKLADHLRRTSRLPEHNLQTDEVEAQIDFALIPRD